MRKLTIMVLVLAVALTNLAVAKEDNPRTLQGPAGFSTEVIRAYVEGFEGNFPPDNWTHSITNPSYTWFKSTVAYEGYYGAHINWQDMTWQNEILSFQHFISTDADEYYLSFATMGSPYWTMNADFTVRVNGTPVWSFHNDFPGPQFVWDIVNIDLAALGYNNQQVTIAFVYEGNDGADHHLDAVSVAVGPPPPPPPVSFCDLVLHPINEIGLFYGDTCIPGVNNSPAFLGGGYGAGYENYYEVFMPAGSQFRVNLIFDNYNVDAVVHIVDSCTEPITSLAFYDYFWYSPNENITFPKLGVPTYPEDRVVYLVIDSRYPANPCGTYSFEFIQLEGEPVATEIMTLSSVKSLFQ